MEGEEEGGGGGGGNVCGDSQLLCKLAKLAVKFLAVNSPSKEAQQLAAETLCTWERIGVSCCSRACVNKTPQQG